jgi:Ca2+-binding RTX toxin-like protein
VSIENLTGSNFNDTLTGNGGNNVLNGLEGFDKLFGNGGNDILVGGLNQDTLNGGLGSDTFDYNEEGDSSWSSGQSDVIVGFDGADTAIGDRIDLSTIDADLELPGNQAFTAEQLSYFDEVQNGVLYGVLWVDLIGPSTGPELEIKLVGSPELFIQVGHPGSDILL